MKDFKKKKRPGFTLVEMVVVVSILGILAGLGFMKFDQVQVQARGNADQVAATNLATAASLYLNDYPNEKTIEMENLKDKYISIVPEPQSIEGDFIIGIDNKGEIKVSIKPSDGGEELQLYPKVSNS